jgi:hypothetical protein
VRFASFCKKLVFASAVAFTLSAPPVHSNLSSAAAPQAGERLAAAPTDVFRSGKNLRLRTGVSLQGLNKELQAGLARHGLRVTLSGDEINVASGTPIRVLRKLTALLPGDFEVYVWTGGPDTQYHGVLTDLRSEHWMSRHRGARRLRLIAEPFYFYSLKAPGERKPRLIGHAVPRNTAPFERIVIRRKPAWTLATAARPARRPAPPPAVIHSETGLTDRPDGSAGSDSAPLPLGVVKGPGMGDEPPAQPVPRTDPLAETPGAVTETRGSVEVKKTYVLTHARFSEFAAMPLTREPSQSRMAMRLRQLDNSRFEIPRPPADKGTSTSAKVSLAVNAPAGAAPASPSIDFETLRRRAAFEAAAKLTRLPPPESSVLPPPGHTPARVPNLGLALIAALLAAALICFRPLRNLYGRLRGARALPATSTALERSVRELMDAGLLRGDKVVDLGPVKEALAMPERRWAWSGPSSVSNSLLVLEEFSRVIDDIRHRGEQTDTRRAERVIEIRRCKVLARVAA